MSERDVVVRGVKSGEWAFEYAELREAFWEHLNPVGPVEGMLVDRIVVTHWRLRRAVRAESGEIALNVEGGHWRRNRPSVKHGQYCLALGSTCGDAALEMLETTPGLGRLINRLNSIRAIVEKDGELTEEALKETYFDGEPGHLTEEIQKLRMVEVEQTDGQDEAALKTQRRDKILDALKKMAAHYMKKMESTIMREDEEEKAHQTADVLPSAEILNKILNYETRMDRQLYRALSQLERLQRARQGEVMPPPMSLEVSAAQG